MTLQTKVTLGSVLLATVIVTVVSGVDLGGFIDLELKATLERADVIKDMAKERVLETVNLRRDLPLDAGTARRRTQAETAQPVSLTQWRSLHRYSVGG